MTLYYGLDLSKNHYGFTCLQPDGTTVLVYTRIKDMTKKETQVYSNQDYIYNTDLVKDISGFKYYRCTISVNPDINKILSDCFKSEAINMTINEFIKITSQLFDKDDIFVSLEDYIVMNNGIVSLVHTTEQFKYNFLKSDIKPSKLFLCCNSTWKKLLGKEASQKPKGKDRYENIKLCIKNNYNDLFNLLSKLKEDKEANEDVIKDLIDSWALAIAGNTVMNNPLFKSQYHSRIYTNRKESTNERKEGNAKT